MRLTARRYITAAKAAEMNHARVEFVSTGRRSYNIMTNEWTDWYIVPDDDPRVDTIKQFEPQAEEHEA